MHKTTGEMTAVEKKIYGLREHVVRHQVDVSGVTTSNIHFSGKLWAIHWNIKMIEINDNFVPISDIKTFHLDSPAIHEVIGEQFDNPGRIDTTTLLVAQQSANEEIVPIKVNLTEANGN